MGILSTDHSAKSGTRFSVGLSYRLAQEHLPYLIAEGYLRLSADEKNRLIYEISPKGRKLLRLLKGIPGTADAEV